MGLFRNRTTEENSVTVLADGTAMPTPPQATVASELNRLATERAEIEAAIKTDTRRRAADRPAWELRDRERHDALNEVEGRIELLEEWGPAALHLEQDIHAYRSEAEAIEARHRSVLTHFSYNLMNGHEVGSVARDLDHWWLAISKLSYVLDKSPEVPETLARDYATREANRWTRLRSAHECAKSGERDGVSMPYPEFAEERTGTADMPRWLHIGASRADK